MKVKDLKPAGYNPRKISPGKLEALKKSMEEFGDLSGIVFNVRTQTLIGGHQRIKNMDPTWKIIKKPQTDKTGTTAAGYVETPHGRLIYREVDWPEEKEKMANIAANQHGGEFDDDLLKELLDNIKLADPVLDIELIGFDEKEFNEIMALGDQKETSDAEPQIDRAEELNKVWQVNPGDLWQIGEHRLLCGDSTKKEDVERVMGGEKAGMVFTDPPYGISVVKNRHIGGWGPVGGKKNYKGTIVGNNIVKANQYNLIQGDNKPFDPMFLLELSENLIIFGGNYFANKLPNSRGWLVWDKLDGMDGTTKNFSDFEMAWTSFDKPARLFRHRWQGLMKGSERDEKRCHPTQKPVQVCIDILEYYGNGENIIIDPFLGSGTTMVACQNLNRKCRGIEISPDYCAVILQRMADAFPGIEIKRINYDRS